MTVEQLKKIISGCEGLQVEFKTSSFQLSRDVFESICAFLNRNGGHLLLGVTNSGKIEGVLEDSVSVIINSLITSCNDPFKLYPTFYLSPEVFDVEDKKVIYIFVPQSSQVHSTSNKIFDRNSDGDFDITNNQSLVTQLYISKQTSFSENQIYPYVSFSDFLPDLFERIRKLAKNQRPNHPWGEMSNEELLRSSSLWKKDYQSGKEGYTLGAIVLLGKGEVIHDILPHYKTDVILRKDNIDRYDDRDDIRYNLIDAYDNLNAFIRKHLPDKFHLEGNQRISLRDKIFREVIGNILIHREFSNAFPAKMIIEADRVYTENWNKPHGNGRIDPSNFSPFPKNPTIARFFKEIGWVDELGSGIRNITKYCKIYNEGNGNAEFIDGYIFKTIIPLPLFISRTANIETKKTITISDTTIFDVKDAVDDSLKDAVTGAISDAVDDAVNDAVTDAVKARLKQETHTCSL